MAMLDLQLVIMSVALSLAFVGSPLLDAFLKGPKSIIPGPRARRSWWLFFLSVWFAFDGIVALAVGFYTSPSGLDYWPTAFLIGGLLALLVTVGFSV